MDPYDRSSFSSSSSSSSSSVPRPPFIHPSRLSLIQSGRRSKDTPYNKPSANKSLSSRISSINPNGPVNAPKGKKRGGRDARDDVLRDNRKADRLEKEQHSKFGELIRGEEIKDWLRSKLIGPGVVNMSVSISTTFPLASANN